MAHIRGSGKEFESASTRIAPYILRTPVIRSESLSHATFANVHLKLESIQPTGSFKVRGAFNKLLSLTSSDAKKGVTAASSGNFGAAISYAANKLGINAKVYAPVNATSAKLETIKRVGAEIILAGDDCALAEKIARADAEKHNCVYASSYNDKDVVLGQGGIAVELCEQLTINTFHSLYVSVGGGGLIVGVAAYLKQRNPQIQIAGCLPENSPAMSECIRADEIIDVPIHETLSDGTAGKVEPSVITFPLCQKFVDEFQLASEADIARAVYRLLTEDRLLDEASIGVSLACLKNNISNIKNKNIIVIVCGSNISLQKISEIVTFSSM